MSEMSSETGSSTASDSGGGSAAEAGTSGPAEAGDQAGAGSVTNDSMPQAAQDNAAQDSSDASTENSYDGAASFPAEPGEAGPPGVGDEVNFPDAGDEAFPEVSDEVPDLSPGTEPSPTTMADSSSSDSDIWKRSIRPDFNEHARPNDGSGGDQRPLTPPDKLTPRHIPPDTFINPKTPAP